MSILLKMFFLCTIHSLLKILFQETKLLWFSKRILNVEIQFVKNAPSWVGPLLSGLFLQEACS